jgi:hypothetical protein
MKKLLLTSLFLLISLTFFAQASFTATGIAVQGIARDDNNTAYQNQNITLEFEFYYKDESNAEKLIGSKLSKQVVTDNFGVFSTIIDPDPANNAVFANQKVWLRISNKEDARVIQESQLMHVPYAISANNGVPAGTILPFVGTKDDVPNGWLLCAGVDIPVNNATLKLRTLLGSTKTPNLKGMFLRGAGTNTNTGTGMDFTSNDGPALNKLQDDVYKSHNHLHDLSFEYKETKVALKEDGKTAGDVEPYYAGYAATVLDQVNKHVLNGITLGLISSRTKETLRAEGYVTLPKQITTKTGSIQNSGGLETRPVNYGVNYIIKL